MDYVGSLWVVAKSPDGKVVASFIYTPWMHTPTELASIIRYYRNRNWRLYTEWRYHEKVSTGKSTS